MELPPNEVPVPDAIARALDRGLVPTLRRNERSRRRDAFESVADRPLQQGRRCLVLAEVVRRAPAHGVEVDINPALAGDQDEREVGSLGAASFDQLDPAAGTETIVDHPRVVAARSQCRHRVREVFEDIHLDVGVDPEQPGLHEPRVGGFVVDDQYA